MSRVFNQPLIVSNGRVTGRDSMMYVKGEAVPEAVAGLVVGNALNVISGEDERSDSQDPSSKTPTNSVQSDSADVDTILELAEADGVGAQISADTPRTVSELRKYRKQDLVALAERRGVSIGDCATRADVLKRLEEALGFSS